MPTLIYTSPNHGNVFWLNISKRFGVTLSAAPLHADGTFDPAEACDVDFDRCAADGLAYNASIAANLALRDNLYNAVVKFTNLRIALEAKVLTEAPENLDHGGIVPTFDHNAISKDPRNLSLA